MRASDLSAFRGLEGDPGSLHGDLLLDHGLSGDLLDLDDVDEPLDHIAVMGGFPELFDPVFGSFLEVQAYVLHFAAFAFELRSEIDEPVFFFGQIFAD